MDEYIEREAAIESIMSEPPDAHYPHWYANKIKALPAANVAPVRHGRWEDGRCSNCKGEAVSTGWDEPIFDYDWEENLRYSHTETHTEYRLTNYCPNCGARMDKGDSECDT